MSFQAEYSKFDEYNKKIISNNDLLNFKRHPDFTYMLEHVIESVGEEYLKLLLPILSIDDIIYFCSINDSIGNPKMYIYKNLECSSTSLRYLYHAYLCLNHFKTTKLHDIVEIGGGYGGLCLAINYLSKKMNINISSYTIIDLPHVSKLQNLYLSKFDISFNYECITSELFGKNITKNNLFLISNYSFSEILPELQKKYIENLFPKVLHGFITWNHVPVFDFGYTYSEELEVPLTSPMNKFIRF